MFERLMMHGAALARNRARALRAEISETLRAEAPEGVRVTEADEGVALEGRGLKRRFALDPELRWLISGRRR